MSFGWRGLFGDDIPIDTEFFQCTPILILLFDVLAIFSSLVLIEGSIVRGEEIMIWNDNERKEFNKRKRAETERMINWNDFIFHFYTQSPGISGSWR